MDTTQGASSSAWTAGNLPGMDQVTGAAGANRMSAVFAAVVEDPADFASLPIFANITSTRFVALGVALAPEGGYHFEIAQIVGSNPAYTGSSANSVSIPAAAGTQRLAQLSPALTNPDDALLPDFGDAPAVNLEVGIAVAEAAIEEGVAGVDWKKDEVRTKAVEKQWKPEYGVYVYDPNGES